MPQGQVLKIPIAHGEGNYFAEPDVIERLERNRQVVFRYVTSEARPRTLRIEWLRGGHRGPVPTKGGT
jgi:phosphoribosylformylglycinamidine (FGAM) synthase-like amidotransferase family enzyme